MTGYCPTCGRPYQGTEEAKGCLVEATCFKQGNENCLNTALLHAKVLLGKAHTVLTLVQPHLKTRVHTLRSQQRFNECSEATACLGELVDIKQEIVPFLRGEYKR